MWQVHLTLCMVWFWRISVVLEFWWLEITAKLQLRSSLLFPSKCASFLLLLLNINFSWIVQALDEKLQSSLLRSVDDVIPGHCRRATDSDALPNLRLEKLFSQNRMSAGHCLLTVTFSSWVLLLLHFNSHNCLQFLPHHIDDIPELSLNLSTKDGSASSQTFRIPDEVGMVNKGRPQFAVHLGTTSCVGITTPLDGISGEYDKLTKDEMLRR